MKRTHQLKLATLAILLAAAGAQAQISISTSTAYTQNFDGIGTANTWTMPTNWRMRGDTATPRVAGAWSAASASVTGQIGGNALSSSATYGLYNFGAGVAASATDRAVGSVTSGNASSPDSAQVVAFLNNGTGSALTGLDISYSVEKYREGSNTAGYEVQMYYSTDGTTWTSAGASFRTLFAADAATTNGYTPAPGVTTPVSQTLTVAIPNSSNIYLQWVVSVASGTTYSNSQAISIDNVSILGNAPAGDTTPPTVSSINRQSAENPTNDSTVTWRVIFNENINSGTVNTGDFTLTATAGAVSGASVTTITPVNATTFDVTAGTGTGDKTLRLDLLPAAAIADTSANDYNATFITGQTFTIDLTAPVAPSTPDLDVASDSGSSNSDDLTNDTTPTLTGTAVAGSTVTVISDISGNLGTTVATGGNWSFTPGSAIAAGTHAFTATATDAVGNTSSASVALDVTIDTTAPVAPTGLDLAVADDSGSNNSDNLTKNTSGLTISGTAEAGSTVTLKDGSTSLNTGSAAIFATGIDINLTANATTNVTATATDGAGNESSASTALSITTDTIAPLVQSRVPAPSATISSLTDVELTFDSAVAGVAAGDLTVNSSAATGIAGSSPTFTFGGFASPADGPVNVALAASSITDAAGNAFAGDSWTYTKNTSVPSVTVTASVADNAWTNTAAANYTATFNEGVSGLLDTEINITNGTISGFTGGPSVYTFTVTANAGGDVVVSVPAGVAEGTTAPTGRLNTVSNTYTVKYDAIAPVSAATVPSDSTVIGTAVAIDFTANDALSGVASTALFVKVPSSGSFVNSGLTPSGSTFSYTAAENGAFEFYTVSTDVAGNAEAGPAGADVTVIVNTVENGSYSASVATGSNVTVTIPMENNINIVVTFANVSTGGTLTAQRFETDAAPAGVAALRLIDQWLTFAIGGGLVFDQATVTVGYDEALLGELTEGDIDIAFRNNSGTVTEISPITVNATNNTIEFTTPGFSDFYFGNNDADVADWTILGEE